MAPTSESKSLTPEDVASQIDMFQAELEGIFKEGHLMDVMPTFERRVSKWVHKIRSHEDLKPCLDTKHTLWRVFRHYKIQTKAGKVEKLKGELEALFSRGNSRESGAQRRSALLDEGSAPPKVNAVKRAQVLVPDEEQAKKQAAPKPQAAPNTQAAPKSQAASRAQAAPKPAAAPKSPKHSDAPQKPAPVSAPNVNRAAPKKQVRAGITGQPKAEQSGGHTKEKGEKKGEDKGKVKQGTAPGAQAGQAIPLLNAKSKAKVKTKGQVAAVLQAGPSKPPPVTQKKAPTTAQRDSSPHSVIIVRTIKSAKQNSDAHSVSSADVEEGNTDAPGHEEKEWVRSKKRKADSGGEERQPRRKAKGARQDETEDEEHSDESDVEDQGPQHKKARTESKAAPAKGKGKATVSKAKAAKGTGKKRGRPSKMDGFPTIALTSDTCIVKAIPCEVAQPQFNHYSVAPDGLIGFACAECHRLKKRCLWNGLPEICDSSATFSIAAEKDTVEDDISRLEGLILELGAKNAALESKVATLEKKVAAQEKVFIEKLSNLGDRLEVEVESVESKWETAHARLTDRVTEAEGKFRRLSKDVKVVAPADVARVEMKADSALKRLDDTVRVSESVLSQMDDVKSKLAELDDLVRTEPKATGAEASAPLDDAEERQAEEEDSPEDVPGGVDGSASKVDMAEPMDIETQPNSPSGPGSPVGPPTDDSDMDTESDVDDPPAPATLPPLQPTTPTTPAPDEPKPASAPPSPTHSPCQLSPPGPAPPSANSHDDIDERVDYGEPDD
ncbi:hypothetical protein CPC08DRAFT_768531 [Agrocybe pediades]|nr:hypothetical protein CPC08DRAFT_768531 [Agrocybe pediades]